MFYVIYKTTNKTNNKIYIGKHQTTDVNDGYLGSGKLIRRAIAKYGISNFTKEILFVFDNASDMNNKEKELVVVSEETYNLCPGGQGGFGYINNNGLNGLNMANKALVEKYKDPVWKAMMRKKQLKCASMGGKVLVEKYKDPVWKAMMRKKHQLAQRIMVEKYRLNDSSWCWPQPSDETRAKMKISASGNKNSQFGSMWITDGTNNSKIMKTASIPNGWKRGRTNLHP